MELIFYRLIYPLAITLGKLLPSRRLDIEYWLITRNNWWVKKYLRNSRPPEQILLLLPHCLQWTECRHRLVGNILNCAECGKCNIKDIIALGQKYGIIMKVATGGRLALRLVSEINPQFLLAVACERELVEGLLAIWPKRAAVINLDRPFGPCVNTRVNTAEIEEWIKIAGGAG